MKKQLQLLFISGLLSLPSLQAQIGIGTTSPHSSAALEVSSTDKGVLLPRLTTTQRDAISSPSSGLLVYNTVTSQMNLYNGTAWEVLANDELYKLPIDSDGDGITDALETHNGSNPNDGNSPTTDGVLDADNDGIPKGLEVLVGWNDADVSIPVSSGGSDVDGDGIFAGFEVINSWSDGGLDIPISSGSTDTDGDGLPFALETLKGWDDTDSNNPYTDGALDEDSDGLKKGWELFIGQSDFVLEPVIIGTQEWAALYVGQDQPSDTPHLFQYYRKASGHEVWTSSTTTYLLPALTNSSAFVLSSSGGTTWSFGSPGLSNWTGAFNICEPGFHVPTDAEVIVLRNWLESLGYTNGLEALGAVFPGVDLSYRKENGVLSSNIHDLWWISGGSSVNNKAVRWGNGYVGVEADLGTSSLGMKVRCIKD